jgi:hypothetical protein
MADALRGVWRSKWVLQHFLCGVREISIALDVRTDTFSSGFVNYISMV